MSDYKFATMPSVSIARSKFVRSQPHGTSFNLGELVVLGFDEVIPGSTHKIDIGSLIRMSTPIAPIMDDIQCDIFSFFVPMRLTWQHWKQFMGESDQAGIANVTYTIPQINKFQGSKINTVADDLGLVGEEVVNNVNGTDISVLPFRAFALIYNRWFRNQNVEAPIPVSTADTVTYGELQYLAPGVKTMMFNPNQPDTFGTTRYKAYKLPDYFTSALPYAQKGQPVQIFGDNALAPVVAGDNHATSGKIMNWSNKDGTAFTGNFLIGAANDSTSRVIKGNLDNSDNYYTSMDYSVPSNLWANLNAAVNTTINDLRFAFQLQKALEKDALYGSRYWEVLRAHYAVTSPDASLQDPQILGQIKFDINISQVLQTTGFTSPSSTNLGTPGANSVTASRGHLFTASFVEHGYIFHVLVARQKHHTYSQGMNKTWLRKERFDFYHPVFANLGAQKVLNKEIYFNGGTTGDQVFGYQEAWAEYRFLPGYNSGLLNPSRNSSLDYWNLADNYGATPTLGPTFLKEDRSNLARCLVTGVNGPDFIGNFYIKDTVVNPMPLYSIPGFADHH